jgi:hypothetical protein
MPLMWRTSSLHMEWCLECHREPERFIRPRAAIFDMDWDPDSISSAERAALIEEYDVQSQTNCNACHR